MYYDKKIKYLELVKHGVALQNAGFIKLEMRDDRIKLKINVDRLPMVEKKCAKIFLVSAQREMMLGEIHLEQGRGSVTFEASRETGLMDGMDYEDLQEIKILLSDSMHLHCCIRGNREVKGVFEKEQEIIENPMIQPELEATDNPRQEPELGDIVLEAPPMLEKEGPQLALQMPREEYKEKAEGVPETRETHSARAFASNKWQQLWETYPHINPFEDRREYLKLKPEDLVVLSRECYPLISNSFLLHGFYNYQHLILTKELSRGQEQYYIGTPGNFFAKEKQVAILFGFESFEGKAVPAQNGDFGYYMIPVEI